MRITRRHALVSAAAASLPLPALAQSGEPVRIGLIAPMTGPFTSTGRMMDTGARLYMQLNGDTVAGRKVQLILKDDTGVADVTKRIAQEMVVNEKVDILTGFGLTPLALATAPIATQAKVAQVIMLAATPVVTTASPYIVRPSFTTGQTTEPMADWALKNGIKSAITLVSDYAPGVDTEVTFVNKFKAGGGAIVESIRVPLANRDFAPYLQKVADAKADALFVFVPAGIGATLLKQYVERGLNKTGMKLLGEGSVTEDDILTQMDDNVIGMITSHHYSAAHDSPENKAFVAAYKKAYDGKRPNLTACAAYDAMHLIYEALKKTGGKADGDSVVAAMKGMSWTSPRGPVSIDPETREVIQNIYIRRVEKKDGELWNTEFETVANVKDPSKVKK